LPSDAPAAQPVDIPGVEVAEILAALGAVVQIGFQARITLTLLVYLIVVRMQGLTDLVDIIQVSEDLLLAHFPVFIPVGFLPTMFASCAVPPHACLLFTTLDE
jgi:hypothetical protein